MPSISHWQRADSRTQRKRTRLSNKCGVVYRRQQREQVAGGEAGLPSSVAPATTAGNEFIQAIPVKDPPTAQKTTPGQLQPPGTYTGATPPANQVVEQSSCGWDARTGQAYRFNPQTGVPCMTTLHQDQVVVRQASPAQY